MSLAWSLGSVYMLTYPLTQDQVVACASGLLGGGRGASRTDSLLLPGPASTELSLPSPWSWRFWLPQREQGSATPLCCHVFKPRSELLCNLVQHGLRAEQWPGHRGSAAKAG